MQDTHILYDKNNKVVDQNYDLRWLNVDAQKMARTDGRATIISICQSAQDLCNISIHKTEYIGSGTNSSSLSLPKSVLEVIADVYKK